MKLNKISRCFSVCLCALAMPELAAQVSGGALDYMLQRPRVTKTYEHKKFGDHLFLEGGAGVNLLGSANLKPGVQLGWSFGDWVTPEHGWRVGLDGGVWRTGGVKAKYAEWTIDYLMNITAIAQRAYTAPHRFEVYGISGFDWAYSRHEGQSAKGVGFHLGMRGQYAFSPYTYMYIEPRGGILNDDVTHAPNWRGIRPVASVSVGVGYRLAPWAGLPAHRADTVFARSAYPFGEGTFFSLMAGPAFVANSHPTTWEDYFGGRAAVSIGKWFTPVHALRLTANATLLKQRQAAKVKAVGGQLEYMVNLHNVFGGYDPDRYWWVNALVGGGVNVSTAGAGKHTTLGASAALQGNVRLGRGMSLFVEPRVDIYNGKYATSTTTVDNCDVVPSLLVGTTYTYSTSSARKSGAAASPFVQTAWHDHTFVEMGLGGNLPVTRAGVTNPFDYFRPQAYAAVGKWFTPLHGLRLWGQVAQTEYNDAKPLRYKHAEMGADYLFNVSNALFGYDPYRRFELSGALGLNLSARQKHHGLYLGGDLSLRGTWYPNELLGLFIEPRLQGYGKRYLPTSLSHSKLDLIASAMAGVQFNMRGYDRLAAKQAVEADGGLLGRLSWAAGVATPANRLRSTDYYGPVGRISYESCFSPLSAWRVGLQGYISKDGGRRYASGTVGLDYLTDLTAQTYGYDPERVLTLNALVGMNVGADYGKRKTHMAADAHFGGQMAVRVAPQTRIYLEPQLAYRLSSRFKGERLERWMPQLLVGVDYSLKKSGKAADVPVSDNRHFLSASVGTGAFTGNFTSINPRGRKLTFISEVAYGQWVSGVHGWQIGLSNTLAQRRGPGSENLTSLRADYALNMRAAISGERTDDKVFQITGLAGASLTFGSHKDRKVQVVPGLQAAIQAGWRVTPSMEIYLQPEGALYPRTIEPGNNNHPIDGEVRLSLGTKYCF